MLVSAEKTEGTGFAWDPGEETVVPNNHRMVSQAFTWDADDDSVVPGHHKIDSTAFTWSDWSR